MTNALSSGMTQQPVGEQSESLLAMGEVVLIVDDYPEITLLLKEFLKEYNLTSIAVGSAAEMRVALKTRQVALVLLDIGLPDENGMQVLPEITQADPDLAIVMLTGVTDLGTALDCLRQGADDYLTKPVKFEEVLKTVRLLLEKRRLVINNRNYQRQIEQARFRIQLLHELTLKMNSTYLSTVELDEILHSILVGITMAEGLGFNRAFLALFDEEAGVLSGRMAIGPGCPQMAAKTWSSMQDQKVGYHEIILNRKAAIGDDDARVNQIVHQLAVPLSDEEHILLRVAKARCSVHVIKGQADWPVPASLMALIEEETFVITPLFSPRQSLGVIIADNFVTRQPISPSLIQDLETYASQASLAIEHCNLYQRMENKIEELECVTEELEQNKDLLVEAERYSALGHMAAQLAHNIRNPVATLGGTARLLAKKNTDSPWLKFINIMISETARIEAILKNLFSFIEKVEPQKAPVALYSLVNRSLMLYYKTMEKQGIEHRLILPEPEPVVELDARQVQRMLVHLIRNSIESMSEGGVLTLSVAQQAETVIITLKDSGEGMEAMSLARATDPFYTTKIYGTGMGLTLVKRVIDEHGGKLTLQSPESGGTEVIVTLPLKEIPSE